MTLPAEWHQMRPSSPVDASTIEAFQRHGVVRIPAVLSPEEIERFRDAAASASERLAGNHAGREFHQTVDVWRQDDTLRELTLHPGVAAIATQLAGVQLRIWHDQLLIKPPHNGAATQFHQDAPYWPHARSRAALSAWIALVDVPPERGCMTFVPGSHSRRDLRAQDLSDSRDLFSIAPELEWQPRWTIPLRAGDCTFHDAYVAHTANANDTDEPRVAHVNIYIDANTLYDGRPHVVTDGLALDVGRALPDERFPRLSPGA